MLWKFCIIPMEMSERTNVGTINGCVRVTMQYVCVCVCVCVYVCVCVCVCVCV